MPFTLLSLHLCDFVNIHCPKRRTLNTTFTDFHQKHRKRLLNAIFQDFQVVLFRKSLGEVLQTFHLHPMSIISVRMSMSLYEFPRNWLLVSRESNHWERPWDAVSKDIESFDLVTSAPRALHSYWATALSWSPEISVVKTLEYAESIQDIQEEMLWHGCCGW